MAAHTPQTIYLKDYQVPSFLIETVDLKFDLHEDDTLVKNTMRLRRNPKAGQKDSPLELVGEDLRLVRIAIDGREMNTGEYELQPTLLILKDLPTEFTLEIETRINPRANTALEGLYMSGGMFCTQNEAQGFRRITFFLDRPDVMAVYTTTVEADQSKFPVLLSNGNCIEKRDLGNGRHLAKWHDPFKKPCYLYALVAGDLARIEDTFTTMSGRKVQLEIYAKKGLESRCWHAMESLKLAMKWDEENYGREYDLDIYMVVAVDDFNAGAMENKGLNIFNSSYVFAKPETATDIDYSNIAAVVAHEYFHNWTGNRITCRDWFQLSLKEGLTVFRDQMFSADMTSHAVARIDEAIKLRTYQFAEDAGPMAHPVRPQSYMAINNFYTLTVYEKGAEVIRMLHTLLGPEAYRKGTDKYFELFDGQAVTTDDWVHAMETANGVDLTLFKNWYDQAGTPELHIDSSYDSAAKTYTLTVRQSCPATPGQSEKKPFHIPLAVGLLDSKGQDIPLLLEGESTSSPSTTKVLHVKEPQQSFRFKNVSEKPVPSLLRKFSAPVKLNYEYSDPDLVFLMANDTDAFVRWEAGQKLVIKSVQDLVAQYQAGQKMQIAPSLLEAFGAVLKDARIDAAFKAQMLTLPAETYLAQFFPTVDVEAIHEAREFILQSIAERYQAALLETYRHYHACGPYKNDPKSAGERELKNTCLSVLMRLKSDEVRNLALEQLTKADNMTDEIDALESLNTTESHQREKALKSFYAKWKDETLVINKWLAIQATGPLPSTLETIQWLMKDPVFDINNPNKVYSLIAYFGMRNPLRFHAKDGGGYRFMADRILDIDSRNQQVAARLASTFNQWKRFDPSRQKQMRAELERILAKPGLSENVYEIVSKALAQ